MLHKQILNRYLSRFKVSITEIEAILAGGVVLKVVQQKVGAITEYLFEFKVKILVCCSSSRRWSFSWRLR